jgi:hypothetical protein
MAETRAAPAPAAAAEECGGRKTVVVVGVDDSDHSYSALEWAVRHVATAAGAELVVVHGKPSASSVVSFGSPGAGRNPPFSSSIPSSARDSSWRTGAYHL